MAKRINKLIPFALMVIPCLSGCGKNVKEENVIDFWSTSSAEKVYLDKSKDLYTSIKGPAQLDILAFKGEHEAKQLIMTPSKDVKCFNATVTDLVSDGGDKIEASKITIYVEKYLNMTKIYDSVSTAPTGRVPDGLVPVANSLKYNDNKIAANTNQGLYIDVDIPVEQAAGVYKGNVTVTIDGVDTIVPMSVDVKDVTVSQEKHQRSIFLDHWQFWNGEMDSTEAMYDKYHMALADYRLCPDYAIIETEITHTDAGVARYVNKSYDLMQYKNMNTICIPYQVANYGNQVSFSEPVMKKYIRAFYEKSCETNFNMLENLAVYFGGIIDEPYEFGLMDRAKVVSQRYKTCINEIATELSSVHIEHPMHSEFIESIKKIRQPITTQWQSVSDSIIETYCPKANFYDSPELRAHYDSQEEKWWYTCVEPHMPYPTYHLEDTLSSGRLLSWMQANYDVVGNLFWAVNVYAQMQNGSYFPIEDYFSGRADRYFGCNGDGFLFYPGAQYGYDGPLPSTRVQAIRDGLEEYELLYSLKQKAKELEVDEDAMFTFLTSSLYDEVKVTATSSLMEKARATLGELVVANSNGSEFTISKCDVNKTESKAELGFFAKSGATIKLNGETLSNGVSYKDGYLYSKTIDLSSIHDVDVEVEFDGKTNIVSSHLCGDVNIYDADSLKDSFEKYNASVTTKVETVENQKMLKLFVGKPKNSKQSIKFNAPFISKMVKGLKEITLNVYNPTQSNMLFSVGGKNLNNAYDNYYTENYSLKPGMNSITLSTLYLRLTETSNIEYFFFVFGSTSSKNESSKEFYIKDIILTQK